MRFIVVLMVFLTFSGCSGSPLSLLTGGGPNVAANVQAGKTNSQTVGTTENYAPSVSIRPNSRVDTIDQSKTENTVGSSEKTIVNNNSLVLILIAILGWLLPSPNEIGRTILRFFKKD